MFIRRTKGVNGNTQLSVTANDFNNHFYKTVANVTSTVPATEFLDRLFGDRVVPPLEFSYIDSGTVSSVVSGLDFHKATGSDELSTRFIRASPHMVITVLFNKCISNSLVPYQWKQAVVTPVLKCKQCTALSQFRPISVLPILSKVLEWIVYNQIVSHLHKYDLLSAHQSGFRAGYSTQDLLLHVTDKWLKAIDESKYTGAVLLDLVKAFNAVDHAILLPKLRYDGFQGASYNLLCSYLSD